ncbi:MAG TPA: sensor domain-containing diguanylate cyclase [Actinotalea sp.]|jgi:diguanylate cyclase (GGDEF)-like protein
MTDRLSVALAPPSNVTTLRRWLGRLAPVRQGPIARPLSDAGALRRGGPFGGIAVVAVVVELVTSSSTAHMPALIGAAASMAVLTIAALALPWRRLPAWCQAFVPLGFFVVIALERHARGGSSSGYPPLVMLPIIWLAIYGTRRQLATAVLMLVATLLGPVVVIGPPLYPRTAWGVALVTIAVAGLGGPLMQRLVEQSRQRAADVAALGRITRALTGESDPRGELCEAAAMVVGARFAALFECGPAGSLVATAGTPGLDLDALRVDPRTETSATAEVWRTGKRLYVADARADPRASARHAAATGAVAVLFEPITRNGSPTAVLVVGFNRSRPRVPEAALDMIELVGAEISAALERAALLEMLAAQARTDALTGAANRRSWDEALERELARVARTGEPLTVALLDMDHFKAYNDANGHTVGDALLRDLVAALRTELRTGDVVARWGGEEFALALPTCDLPHAEAIAARLLTVVPGDQTASIGLALAQPGESPRSLVARADRALYVAKGAGRNQWAVSAPSPVPAQAKR